MSFARWLRTNSEHYLTVSAQARVARKHVGTNRPRGPRGPREWFWLRVFAPAYQALPWALRRRVMRAMPGSHRRAWPPPPRLTGPAV
jgi:hypothetical protein